MIQIESFKNPLVGFNFVLRVELLFDVALKSVKAFSRELEFEYIQEGGLNDYIHMRRKPISKPFTLEIERYVSTDFLDPLPLGAEFTLPVLLLVYKKVGEASGFKANRTYAFSGCTVIKKTYGELDSSKSGLVLENLVLAYREMVCIDV